jgi:hypothetical protein
VFTWWIDELTRSLDDRDREIERSQAVAGTVSWIMDLVFKCTVGDIVSSSPVLALDRMFSVEISSMFQTSQTELPSKVLDLLHTREYSRMDICMSLNRISESVHAKLVRQESARTSTLSSIAWYETELSHLQHSVWGS